MPRGAWDDSAGFVALTKYATAEARAALEAGMLQSMASGYLAYAAAGALLRWVLRAGGGTCLPSGCCRACRWSGTEDLNARLMALAGSWGSGDDAPDLVACARPGTQHIPKVRWGRQAACLPAFLPACLPAC